MYRLSGHDIESVNCSNLTFSLNASSSSSSSSTALALTILLDTELARRQSNDEWGHAVVGDQRIGTYEVCRGVRQLYIDDVNQLPVTPRMPFLDSPILHLYAPTLAACFRASGVSAMIERTRSEWKRWWRSGTRAEGRCETRVRG